MQVALGCPRTVHGRVAYVCLAPATPHRDLAPPAVSCSPLWMSFVVSVSAPSRSAQTCGPSSKRRPSAWQSEFCVVVVVVVVVVVDSLIVGYKPHIHE